MVAAGTEPVLVLAVLLDLSAVLLPTTGSIYRPTALPLYLHHLVEPVHGRFDHLHSEIFILSSRFHASTEFCQILRRHFFWQLQGGVPQDSDPLLGDGLVGQTKALHHH